MSNRILKSVKFTVDDEEHDGIEYEVDFYFYMCPAEPDVGYPRPYNELDEIKAVRYWDEKGNEILMNASDLPAPINSAMVAAVESFVSNYDGEDDDEDSNKF